jgi:hypothetical protein
MDVLLPHPVRACARLSAGWHLDHVEVVDEATGTLVFFPCSQWLDKREGDGATERVLQVLGVGVRKSTQAGYKSSSLSR